MQDCNRLTKRLTYRQDGEKGYFMIDYEAMILERQENIEIWEDDPDSPYLSQHFDSGNWWDEIPDEDKE